MRRQYKKLGHDIACYEKEVSTIRANADSVAELKHNVSAQRDEIIKLSDEVNSARASNQTMEVTVKKQADELKRLITDMNCQRQQLVMKDQQIVQAEKMRKAEEEKRLVAEKELDERRDAQKRMAAMFSELAK
jgi:chromosome segregation ATPase